MKPFSRQNLFNTAKTWEKDVRNVETKKKYRNESDKIKNRRTKEEKEKSFFFASKSLVVNALNNWTTLLSILENKQQNKNKRNKSNFKVFVKERGKNCSNLLTQLFPQKWVA